LAKKPRTTKHLIQKAECLTTKPVLLECISDPKSKAIQCSRLSCKLTFLWISGSPRTILGIAVLFPFCTVVFADIVGFASWSKFHVAL
jgi:hypothetical protein